MYLDAPSNYSYIKGKMLNRNLTKGDFISLFGIDEPIPCGMLQASAKLFKEYGDIHLEPDVNRNYVFRSNRKTLIVDMKDKAQIDIELQDDIVYRLKFNYYNENFSSIEVTKISQGGKLTHTKYIQNIDRLDHKLVYDDYIIILSSLREFIPILLYYIYSNSADDVSRRHENDYA